MELFCRNDHAKSWVHSRPGEVRRKTNTTSCIIVSSTSLSALINLVLNLIVVAIFMVINHVSLTGGAIWFPLILVEVYLLALGLSLFLSATYVKFRDISYIWEVLLQAGFYLTPIIYALSRITNITLQKLILLNPMAQAIQDARYVLITHQTMTVYKRFNGEWYDLVPFILVVLIIFIGVYHFRKQSRFFAENI